MVSPTKKVIVYVDNREASTKVFAILKKKCKLKQKQLDVADYLLSKKVCCERKTSEDFLQSIVDGHATVACEGILHSQSFPELVRRHRKTATIKACK